jgi:hypothetical protein
MVTFVGAIVLKEVPELVVTSTACEEAASKNPPATTRRRKGNPLPWRRAHEQVDVTFSSDGSGADTLVRGIGGLPLEWRFAPKIRG